MAKFAQGLMRGAVFNDPATLDVMTDFIELSENEEVGNVGGTGYGIGLIEFAPGLFGPRPDGGLYLDCGHGPGKGFRDDRPDQFGRRVDV